MSRSLSKHSSIRQSGNSLVVTIPIEIVRELDLNDGDSVFWEVVNNRLSLNIVKLENIFKKGEDEEGVEVAEEA